MFNTLTAPGNYFIFFYPNGQTSGEQFPDYPLELITAVTNQIALFIMWDA